MTLLVVLAAPTVAHAESPESLESILIDQDRVERRIQRGLRRWALHDRLRDGFAHTPAAENKIDDFSFMRDEHWLDAIEQTLLTRALRTPSPDHDGTAITYDIPLSDHELVDVYIEYFTGRGRRHFEKWLARAERYRPMMEPILREHGLPADTFYLAMIESGLSSKAYSVAAASGFWQFIRSTAEIFDMRMDHWVDERRDFVTATHAACRYLKKLHRKFGDWHLAWASYNAGEGRVGRALNRSGVGTYWELVDRHALPKETRHYVPKIIAAAIVAKNARAHGFTDIRAHAPLRYDRLEVKDAIDLKKLATALKLSLTDLRELNPSLLHDLTPPRRPSILRVPEGEGERVTKWIAEQPPLMLVDLRHYRVRRGDTLSGIARQHGVSIASIRDFNDLRSVHQLRVGQQLVVPVSVASKKTRKRSQRTVVAASRERKHVVTAGDTLWSISRRYRCSVDDIRRWNRLRGSSIRSGQVLAIRR